MSPTTQPSAPTSSTVPRLWPAATRRAWRQFAWAVGGLVVVFSLPLFALFRMAWSSDLLSYVLLIPAISGYLMWLRHETIGTATLHRSVGAALAPTALAALLLGAHASGNARLLGFAPGDDLTILTLAFVLLVFAAAFFCLGTDTLHRIAGPAAFLLFTVPPSAAMVAAVETALQHSSAWAVEPMFVAWGTPVWREGLLLTLPPSELGPLQLQVARECSGIHATIVLFVVSIAAGMVLLRSPWARAVLVAAILPIAILRNAVRIFVLGQLSVDVGPHILHSWLHQQGGPIFFAASLVPVVALLVLLRRLARLPAVPVPAPSA